MNCCSMSIVGCLKEEISRSSRTLLSANAGNARTANSRRRSRDSEETSEYATSRVKQRLKSE